MGWLFSYYDRKSMIAGLTRRTEGEGGTHETLRSCVRGNVLWAKHRFTSKADGKVTTYVGCYLMQRSGGLWGFKALDESVGPFYSHCPLSYLEGLSEPVGFAAQWRERVRAYWAGKRKSK